MQVRSSKQHQVEVDNASWMAADRMLTGRPGPVSERRSRVVKFVFTDTDGRIFSWVRADSSSDPVGPHIDFPGGKVDLNETLLQAAHRELGEELSPYGPDLRDKVEAAMSASPNGHSRVWVRLAAHCSHQIMIWGIETSRAVSLSYPFIPSEPFISLETHKNLDARWRSPLEVWSSFRGPRAPYGAAARLAYIPSHVSIGCILLTATGLQGIRGFVQICRAARKLADDGIIQIICLHDHDDLLPGKEHEIGKEHAPLKCSASQP